MLFNSMAFAIFLPLVFLLYWAMPHKYRWLLVLIASYYFYMSWNPKYVFLIFFTTAASYLAALLIEKEKSKKKKNWILAVTAIVCLGILFLFKYFNFVSESIVDFMRLFTINLNPVTLNLVLPVGISFYTFQTLSYVIDVYKGDVSAERHFGYYAAFISFFPQLVAGPIERTGNLLPQIKAEHKFDYNQATYGLKLMVWGYFKKIVVADTLSVYISNVFDMPQNYKGFALMLASLFFSIQIYCDFSGYSDIAIGTAKLLGVNLMTNFKSPYFSQSVKEFWGRWHISLSTWFRDYVYIPLGGNRVGKLRHNLNLLVTFLVSGIWHGANWTFIAWGGIHGVAQVLENIILPKKYKTSKGIMAGVRVVFVFLFCTFAWIFFVSNSIGDAVYVISNMFTGIANPIQYITNGVYGIGLTQITLLEVAIFIFILGVYDYVSLKVDCIEIISCTKPIVRYGVYMFMLCLIMFFRAVVGAEFVYFQF
jgi:D-alanyl-lipoteichoic acid acyltransferase DltB (MBOAT superfamily)